MQAFKLTVLLAVAIFSGGAMADVFPIIDEQVRQLCPGESELVTARACLQVDGNIETQIVGPTSAVKGYRTTNGDKFVVMTGDEDKSIVGGFQVSFRLQKDPNTYIGITRRGDSCGLVTHRPASALDGTQDRSVAWCPSNDFLVLN